jgi:hypothetical protein
MRPGKMTAMTVAGLALSEISAIGGGIQAKQAGDFNMDMAQITNNRKF